MGVLISDEDFMAGRSAADTVTILPDDWQPTAREISRTAVARYHGNQQFGEREVAAKVLPFKLLPRVETVALCTCCATKPRFSSSSFCAECIGRQMRPINPPVIELSEREVLGTWLVVGFLILVLFLSGLEGGAKSEVNVHRQTVRQAERDGK